MYVVDVVPVSSTSFAFGCRTTALAAVGHVGIGIILMSMHYCSLATNSITIKEITMTPEYIVIGFIFLCFIFLGFLLPGICFPHVTTSWILSKKNQSVHFLYLLCYCMYTDLACRRWCPRIPLEFRL